MMDQVGIVALRPGPSGSGLRRTTPTTTREGQSFPTFPVRLTINDGKKVTTPQQCGQAKAGAGGDAREVCVREVPKDVPKVTWNRAAVDRERIGFAP